MSLKTKQRISYRDKENKKIKFFSSFIPEEMKAEENGSI